MTIRHHSGTYPVRMSALKDAVANLTPDCVIFTDQNIATAYPWLHERDPIVLPPGEQSKSLETFGAALSALAQRGASRKTTVVALGGGVIGDLIGFVAASYMRGVPFHQIPTTLLAMVDSSVGGKVAVDLLEGKNLAGAFYPPVAVDICLDALATLPARQFVNGMAEVWKYGFIMDSPLVDRLATQTLQPGGDLQEIVERCIAHKAQVVEDDEFETKGLRAILNFGHTVGHAIERITGYGPVLHGEAISVGMVVEARLGEILGFTASGTTERVRDGLSRQGLPVTSEHLGRTEELLEAMRTDKKAHRGQLAFSLLKEVGHCKLVEGVEPSAIREALNP